jgi:hypothetical protein
MWTFRSYFQMSSLILRFGRPPNHSTSSGFSNMRKYLFIAAGILGFNLAFAQVPPNPPNPPTPVVSSLVIGTTPITGGADTQVLFNSSGVVSSDAGLTKVSGAAGQVAVGGNLLISGAHYLISDAAFSGAVNLNGAAVGFSRALAPTTLIAGIGDWGNGPTGFYARGTSGVNWGSGNVASGQTIDLGLYRNAAGVVEVNNGTACSTAANCRDMVLRHVAGAGTAPTNNACTGFALDTGSSDVGGRVSFNSATSCAINFGVAYANPPFCWVIPGSALSTIDVTRTNAVLTATFGTAQTSMTYGCAGI